MRRTLPPDLDDRPTGAAALAAADERLRELRSAVSRAALSCLRAEPAAAARVRDALNEIDGTRDLLARVELAEGSK